MRQIVGKRLRQLRTNQNLSLRELGKRTGLSHSFICDIEKGRCMPSIETLDTLARSLGVTADYFLNDMDAVVLPDQPTGTEGKRTPRERR